MDTRVIIKDIFDDCGLPYSGIASFSPELFRKAGNPDVIYEKLEPKSFLAALLPYYTKKYDRQNIAKFATVPDYMHVFGTKLDAVCKCLLKEFPENKFFPFCNVDPFAEVKIAQAAGLAVQGRHNLLITSGYGTYVFTGHIVTDLAVTPDTPLSQNPCKDCDLCIKACPTGALDITGVFDRGKCIAAINQKNGELEPWQQELIVKHGRLWGCDICQDACPHNREVKTTFVPEFSDETKHIPYLDHSSAEKTDRDGFAAKYSDRVFLSKNKDNIWRNLKLF